MATEPNLRDLAKAYANGQLEKDKYRIDRTAYIEAILAGTKSIQLNQHAPAAHTHSSVARANPGSDNASLSGEPAYTSIDNNGADSPVPRKTGFIFAGVAAAVISIIIIVVLYAGGKPEAQLAGTVMTDSAAAKTPSQPETTASAAQTLLRSFLDNNTWSDASMDAFVQDWNRLADSDRLAMRDSIELGQMTNAIYKKLLEERALSGIGNPETSYEKQRTLVEFASTIGIQDQRITLPAQADISTP